MHVLFTPYYQYRSYTYANVCWIVVVVDHLLSNELCTAYAEPTGRNKFKIVL